jgi:hypothetical protein
MAAWICDGLNRLALDPGRGLTSDGPRRRARAFIGRRRPAGHGDSNRPRGGEEVSFGGRRTAA